MSCKRNVVLTVFFFLITGVAVAAPEWTAHPGWSSARVLAEKPGRIVAVTGLSWSDGRSAIVSYIDTPEGLYRCTDFKNSSYQSTGSSCEKAQK